MTLGRTGVTERERNGHSLPTGAYSLWHAAQNPDNDRDHNRSPA